MYNKYYGFKYFGSISVVLPETVPSDRCMSWQVIVINCQLLRQIIVWLSVDKTQQGWLFCLATHSVDNGIKIPIRAIFDVHEINTLKQASKQTYSIKTTWRNWKMKWDERWINSMNWSWFKVPVKVEQINEYLFSDTVQSQWKQKVAVMK